MKKTNAKLLLVLFSVLFATSFFLFASSCGTSTLPGEDDPTNVQEAGIDEGDVVKTDGDLIFKAQSDGVTVTKFDDATGSFTLLARTQASPRTAREVLVYGDKLIAIYASGCRQTGEFSRESTVVEIYDVAGIREQAETVDLSDRLLYQASYPADLISSRLITESGQFCFFLQRSGSPSFYSDIFTSGGTGSVASSPIREAEYTVNGERKTMIRKTVEIDEATFVYTSETRSFLCRIDLDGETLSELSVDYTNCYFYDLYMSEDGLFGLSRSYVTLTSSGSSGRGCYGSAGRRYEYFTTVVSLSPSDFSALGYVLMRQFAIKDRLSLKTANGYLYVAAQKTNGSGSTVVAFDAEKMTVAGRADNLAFGEELKSVTYEVADGKVYCYLVTYRNTDPLFRIDATNPSDIHEDGTLKIPGYSTYLHSYAPGLVLGLGYGGTSVSADVSMLKFSLYSVGNGDPVELSSYFVTDLRKCEALDNLHAFCVDRKNGVVGFTASRKAIGSDYVYKQGAYLFRVVTEGDSSSGRLEPLGFFSAHSTGFGDETTKEKDLTRILFTENYYVGVSDGYLTAVARTGDFSPYSFCTVIRPDYDEREDPTGYVRTDSPYGTPFPENFPSAPLPAVLCERTDGEAYGSRDGDEPLF